DPFASNRKPGDEPPKSDKEIYESRIAALEERAEKTVDSAARNLAWIEAALAVDVEDYPRAKSITEKISDETLKADAISYVFYRSALARVKKKELEKAIEL